jgi:hypothetical protein
MLAPPLAALLYPFALKGFNSSVTRIEAVGAGAFTWSWLSAAVCLALAFVVPLIALLAAMSFSEIERPTAAQLRAKRAALLAVAAPTLFTFMGVVLYMPHNPVPDSLIWITCWAIALALLLQSDNGQRCSRRALFRCSCASPTACRRSPSSQSSWRSTSPIT